MFSFLTELLGFVLASVSAVAFGGVYYRFFHDLWQKNSNRATSKRDVTQLRIYALGINFVSAVVLSKVIGVPPSAFSALLRGCLCGFALGGGALAHNYLFTNTNAVVFIIDALFATLSCGLMSTVLYAFNSPHLVASK